MDAAVIRTMDVEAAHAAPTPFAGLRLIAATTMPGNLVVDPAAGSFVVMHAAHKLERQFLGCDIAFDGGVS